MKKHKRDPESRPDPYEDMVRLEKLDPYEALIESNVFHKQNHKSIE